MNIFIDGAMSDAPDPDQTAKSDKAEVTHDTVAIADEPAKPPFLLSTKVFPNPYSLSVPPLYRTRSQSLETFSLISVDDFHELRRVRSCSIDDPNGPKQDSQKTLSWFSSFYKRNKGVAMVFAAQAFGVGMNITTRMLETEGNDGQGMDPFQILFARMSITSLLCSLYMWYKKVPEAPFGPRGVRLLLVARGTGGFFGVFGMYWSLQYLPLSDATVLSFLAPSIACWVCSKIIKEPFTRAERIGALVSLAGVVLIARPTFLFASSSPGPSSASGDSDASIAPTDAGNDDSITPAQHLAAVGMAMVGVFGAVIAYTTIRMIGHRAAPMISVNYFAAWCTLVSTIALAFIPSIPFILPSTLREWILLFCIGVSGFIMQILLTVGLQYEKSSRATNMIYTQMLFALAGDLLLFGTTPGGWSLAGSALILGSALVVAVQKEQGKKTDGEESSIQCSNQWTGTTVRDEEMGLVEGNDDIVGDEEERGRGGAVEMQDFEPRMIVDEDAVVDEEAAHLEANAPVIGEDEQVHV